jgi:murein L,D-transpeptidase YcbB/YkuD
MTSAFKTLSTAGLALALFALGPAWADRPENNFLAKQRNAARDGTVVVPNSRSQYNFSGRSNSNDDGGFFNFFFGNPSNRQSSETEINIDPEIDSSSDVPILTYYADPLVALGRADLELPEVAAAPVFSASRADGTFAVITTTALQGVADPLAATIFERLQAKQSGVRVTKAQNGAIVDFYHKRAFAPLWTSPEGLNPEARELLALFARADEDGLVVRDYLPPALTGFDGGLKAGDSDIAALADAEIGLTAMALRYAMHASGGRLVPDRLSGYHDLQPPTVDPAVALRALTDSRRSPAAYLASLEPDHPAYAALKAALKPLLAEPVDEEMVLPIESGPLTRLGDSDYRIPAIRARLIKLGHLAAPTATVEAAAVMVADNTTTSSTGERVTVTITTSEGIRDTEVSAMDNYVLAGQDDSVEVTSSDDDVYDETLHAAILAFQASAGLQADGVIGERTVGALNAGLVANSKAAQKEKIHAALERLRWLPRNFGRRYVFANQAAFELYVMDGGRQIWQSRVIVGKPTNQTSFFVDEMETVVFNPYWGVPQSIIVKEMLPYLRRDPSYLDRKGFEVSDNSGRKMSSTAVDWWSYSQTAPLNVRQVPGSDNALGEVKFLFPNKHSIYMHDTPTKPLFSKPSRAYSHGCVRVQNPRRFAELMLGWSSDEVAGAIEDRRNKEVKLPQKVPVYLTYFTAWPDAEGNVRFYDDIYGRDQLMRTAAATTDLALRARQ